MVQICDCFQHLSANKNDHLKLIKPDTMIFYMVLDACVRFKLSFKDQLITELMLVVGDAHSITIIAHVHEMKKFYHIDQVSSPFVFPNGHFYARLLSLLFKTV